MEEYVNSAKPWRQGSESKVYILKWNETLIICKHRFKKHWKLPQLDLSLTHKRITQELKSIVKLSSYIKVPRILMTDLNNGCIYMEYFDKPVLVDMLDSCSTTELNQIGKLIGTDLSIMHNLDIIHGFMVLT
jgi:N6-L-threonylcarbamoyladenine synthase/protein kinase Bud32